MNWTALEGLEAQVPRSWTSSSGERRRQPGGDLQPRAGGFGTIYVIDVSGGDRIPRKGGPGITQSDLMVINKTDLAPQVGACWR